MCTPTSIKIVCHHRQEYQHQYAREKKPNSLVNVVGEPRVRITINEDVAPMTNITQIILLTAIKKEPKSIWEVRSEGSYLNKFNLRTPPLMSGGRSRGQTKGQLVDVISIDVDAKKR
jgi:hypothetical protein